MIGEIRIYGRNGKLKKVYDQKEALALYTEANKELFTLSPLEEKYWDRLGEKDTVAAKPFGIHNRIPGQRKHKKIYHKFKSEWQVCGKVKMYQSPFAVYCGPGCRDLVIKNKLCLWPRR